MSIASAGSLRGRGNVDGGAAGEDESDGRNEGGVILGKDVRAGATTTSQKNSPGAAAWEGGGETGGPS